MENMNGYDDFNALNQMSNLEDRQAFYNFMRDYHQKKKILTPKRNLSNFLLGLKLKKVFKTKKKKSQKR